jgi:hypothetical protein
VHVGALFDLGDLLLGDAEFFAILTWVILRAWRSSWRVSSSAMSSAVRFAIFCWRSMGRDLM